MSARGWLYLPLAASCEYVKLTSSGLMVPMISTPEEAEQVVRASKFPPLGVRGQGSPFSCWSHGISTAEYVQTANERLLTLVQIENAEGTKNAEAIAAVEGVGECENITLIDTQLTVRRTVHRAK